MLYSEKGCFLQPQLLHTSKAQIPVCQSLQCYTTKVAKQRTASKYYGEPNPPHTLYQQAVISEPLELPACAYQTVTLRANVPRGFSTAEEGPGVTTRSPADSTTQLRHYGRDSSSNQVYTSGAMYAGKILTLPFLRQAGHHLGILGHRSTKANTTCSDIPSTKLQICPALLKRQAGERSRQCRQCLQAARSKDMPKSA